MCSGEGRTGFFQKGAGKRGHGDLALGGGPCRLTREAALRVDKCGRIQAKCAIHPDDEVSPTKPAPHGVPASRRLQSLWPPGSLLLCR